LAARLSRARQNACAIHIDNLGGQAVIAENVSQGAEQRKMRINAMEPEILAAAPRCLAMTRKGTACQSPAVKGRKRCRMQGGTKPGAPKHGGYSVKTLEAVRYVKAIARLVREVDC
jgi:hypothetical protein